MTPGTRHLVVGRLRRPHGLKGEITVFPLTDDPDTVFAVGRSAWIVNLEGEEVAGPFEIERSRGDHREWLMKMRGVEHRDAWVPWRGLFLGAPVETLAPPADGEVYLHELAGFAVRHEDGTPLGIVSNVFELPGGLMIEVQGPKREFLLPYRKEFVLAVDRDARRLTVAPPDGLIDA